MRGWMRGDHGNTQTDFGELDLIDEHPFGQPEEVASFPSQPGYLRQHCIQEVSHQGCISSPPL